MLTSPVAQQNERNPLATQQENSRVRRSRLRAGSLDDRSTIDARRSMTRFTSTR
jgi:hypothetical protein